MSSEGGAPKGRSALTRAPALRFALFAALAATLLWFAPGARAQQFDAGAAVLQPGPFVLTRGDGSRLDGGELEGAAYGVMFGFAHCPDICPTALAELTAALNAAPDLPKDFRVYFVGVDAERDDPKALGAFLSAFDPRIVGLSGSAEEIDEATRAFGAVARKAKFETGGYTMEHTAALYLVDADGVVSDRVSFREPAAVMARRIAAVTGR